MSSKSTTIVNLILVFFISLLSFSIGTFVGKKYSDNQHQLAALEPNKAEKPSSRDVASVHDNEHGTEKSGTMSDEEIAKLAEEFVADDEIPPTTLTRHGEAPAHGGGGHHEAPTAEAGGHGTTPTTAKMESPAAIVQKISNEPSQAAKDLAHGKTPTTTSAPNVKKVPMENRIPAALPKDVAQYAVGKFTVQVAAYGDEAEAQRMASDLKNKGYSSFYVPANVNGKTWYRVSVGQFATQKEAQTYRSEFITNAKMPSAIVQKIE